MTCSACPAEKIYARGLCSACYWRFKRNGTTARKNVVNQGRCSVSDCDRVAFSKNLCCMHYQKAENPLKTIWKQLRSRCQGGYPEAWDNFDVFVQQIGKRPSRLHQFRRPDPTKAWSLENMVWREPLVTGRETRTREQKAEYAKTWDLRKKYGITPAIYQDMWKAQGGVCAICKKAETRRHRTTGRPLDLVVDHCHRTGDVRGLLCSNCNGGLGSFDDDLDRLRAAIAYLELHAAPVDLVPVPGA